MPARSNCGANPLRLINPPLKKRKVHFCCVPAVGRRVGIQYQGHNTAAPKGYTLLPSQHRSLGNALQLPN